jgi:putative transposase
MKPDLRGLPRPRRSDHPTHETSEVSENRITKTSEVSEDLGGLRLTMPRRTVPFLPDQYYHFYNRGNNRQTVFFERENYLYFLRGLKKYVCEYVEILAYCLMPTHYHLLVRVKPLQTSEVLKTSEVLRVVPSQTSEVSETFEVSVSSAMMRLLVSYTKAINKRFDRVGTLFQGQFQSKLITHDAHLIHLCTYIHANPVKDGLAARPEDWEFSNYLEWLNLRNGTLVNYEFIQHLFGTPEAYQTLVRQYIQTRCLPDDVRNYLQELEG